MPPKNKSKGKKPAKARSPVLINGLTKDEISKEQMEEHAAQLREELDREREERNYFQLERDKMYGFVETFQRKLKEAKAEINIVNEALEEGERNHQAEIKVYKQKMKHVLCEHQNTISGLKADAVVSNEAMQKEQEKLEAEIHVEKEAIYVDMQDVENEKLAWDIELQKHNEEITKLREKGEKQLTEVIGKYERKMELLPQEMENIRKTQISERRQYWDKQMTALKDDQNNAVREWDDVVARIKQDADLNFSLKAQIKDMLTKLHDKEADATSVFPRNRVLADTLLKLEKKIIETQKKAGTFTSKKTSCNTLEEKRAQNLENLKSENEVLEKRVWKLEQEQDELQETVNQDMQKLQREADERLLLLKDRLTTLTDHLKETEARITSVVSASGIDPAAMDRLLIVEDCEDLLMSEARWRAPGVPGEEDLGSSGSFTVEDIYPKM